MQLSDFGIQKVDDNLYVLDTVSLGKDIQYQHFSISAKVKFRMIEKVEDFPEMFDGHIVYFHGTINKNECLKSNSLKDDKICSIETCFAREGLRTLMSLARFKRKNSIVYFDDNTKKIIRHYDKKASYHTFGDGMIYSPNLGSYNIHFTSNEAVKDFVTSKRKNDKMIFIEEITTNDSIKHAANELYVLAAYITSIFDVCESTLQDHIKIHAEPKLYFMDSVIRPSTIDALLLNFDMFVKNNEENKFFDLKMKFEENRETYNQIFYDTYHRSHLNENKSCFAIDNSKTKSISLTDTGLLRLNSLKEITKTTKIFFENEIDWVSMSFFNKESDKMNSPIRERELRFDSISTTPIPL